MKYTLVGLICNTIIHVCQTCIEKILVFTNAMEDTGEDVQSADKLFNHLPQVGLGGSEGGVSHKQILSVRAEKTNYPPQNPNPRLCLLGESLKPSFLN